MHEFRGIEADHILSFFERNAAKVQENPDDPLEDDTHDMVRQDVDAAEYIFLQTGHMAGCAPPDKGL